MTRQEAIKILDAIYFMDDEKQEALRVAIRSLEAWDEVIDELREYSRQQKVFGKYDFSSIILNTMGIVNAHLKEVEE